VNGNANLAAQMPSAGRAARAIKMNRSDGTNGATMKAIQRRNFCGLIASTHCFRNPSARLVATAPGRSTRAIPLSVLLPLVISTVAIRIPSGRQLNGWRTDTFDLKEMTRLQLPIAPFECPETEFAMAKGSAAVEFDALLKKAWAILSLALLTAMGPNSCLLRAQ